MAVGAAGHRPVPLRVLVVDDDALARRTVARLLREDPRPVEVQLADGSAEALRLLATDAPFDAVLCEVRLAGVDGLALARVLARFAAPPRVVFLSADRSCAAEAFEVGAVDYLVKPVSSRRVGEALRRLRGTAPAPPAPGDETIAVELAGTITLVHRHEVRWAEADGDYVRLHTACGSHLVRTTLAELERRWSAAGFLRIHRHTLVALAHVDGARLGDGAHELLVGPDRLPISRRHVGDVRARLRTSA